MSFDSESLSTLTSQSSAELSRTTCHDYDHIQKGFPKGRHKPPHMFFFVILLFRMLQYYFRRNIHGISAPSAPSNKQKHQEKGRTARDSAGSSSDRKAGRFTHHGHRLLHAPRLLALSWFDINAAILYCTTDLILFLKTLPLSSSATFSRIPSLTPGSSTKRFLFAPSF